MGENLYNSANKSNSKAYIEGWERIWGKDKDPNTVKDLNKDQTKKEEQ